ARPKAPLAMIAILTACALIGGVLVLGAIMTFKLGKGTVIVEGPAGGDLPNDVSIVLKDGGKQLEVTAADKWKISVQPGTYQVQVLGGNDTLEVKDAQISVSRFGEQIVKITRREG